MKHIILLALSLATSVYASDYPACSAESNQEILLSDEETPDIVSVSVIGKPCFEAMYRLKITTAAGRSIYQFRTAYQELTAVQWDDPEFHDLAERYLESNNQVLFGISSDLPEQFDEYDELLVPVSYYEKIREKSVPTIMHQLHFERWVVLVYDSALDKVVRLVERGV